jgi:hypothetical protein
LLPLQTKHAVLWRLAENHYAIWHNASLPIFEDGYLAHNEADFAKHAQRPD